MHNASDPKFELLLRHGDDALVHGHLLSEWCAHAPALEEDLALANIALDCLGQAEGFLSAAAKYEGRGRTADDLAYFRGELEFRNVQLAEIPTAGDFALMIAKQFLFDSYRLVTFESMRTSSFTPLAGLAEKSLKEITYHHRHSRSWIIRLGDGTEESKRRLTAALSELWKYVDELFEDDAIERALAAEGACALRSTLRPSFLQLVDRTLNEATITAPKAEPRFLAGGGRNGRHTEHLGGMLAEMQSLARSHPGAKW